MTLTMSRRLAALLGALAAATALAGCAPLLIGGAIVGGSLAVTDRRTSGAQIDDEAIELKGGQRVGDLMSQSGRVSLTSYNRVVLITGAVPTEAEKALIGRTVAGLDSVRSVANELVIGEPTTFPARSNDALITGKVKASLLDAKDIQATVYKVVTERNVVYLMGRVTERESDRASHIARGVSGVRKVVRVFEIVSDAELAGLQRAPAGPAPAPAASNRP